VEEAIQKWPGSVGGAGCGVRFLDLTENLRLADDQRIESRRDAEQMTRDIEIGDLIHVGLQRLTVQVVEVGNELDERGAALIDVVAHPVELSAIAGGQDHRLADGPPRGKRPQGVVESARLEVDPLPQFDRRGAMADSD
jgi:hypothetical protein